MHLPALHRTVREMAARFASPKRYVRGVAEQVEEEAVLAKLRLRAAEDLRALRGQARKKAAWSPLLVATFDGMFELHEEIPSLAAAIACPLNKPRKPKVVGNLCAIQLLNESRKIFSSIFLSRARDVFSPVLGANHFGFLRCHDKSE
jgi:hypothetical protein